MTLTRKQTFSYAATVASSHHEWLLTQLPEWEREGLLTADAAAVLRRRAQAAGAHGGQLGLIIFGGIGTVLVAGGIIALLAHNWDSFPRSVRLILGFTPMVTGQVLAAWVVRGGSAIAAWIREAVALFLALSTGACLAVVSQIYSMGGEWEDFLLACCLLAVPVLWLLRSNTLAMFYLLGISVWVQRTSGWWGGHPQDENWKWYSLLLLPLLGWWPGPQWRALQAPPLGFRWVAALCLMMVMVARADLVEVGSLLALAAVYLLLPEPGRSLARQPFILLGSLVLTGCGFVLSLCTASGDKIWHPHKLSLVCWPLAALAAALAVLAIRRHRWPVLVLAPVALLPALSLLLHAGSLWIIATLQLVLAGVLMILPGFRGEEGSPRLGALLVCAVVAAQFANSDLPLTAKGLGFILVGGGFIAFNILLARRHRLPVQP